MQLHLSSEMLFSANTPQPKRCHSVQSLAQQKTVYDTVSLAAHDLRCKSLRISRHCCKSEFCPHMVAAGGDRRKRCTWPRDVALPQGMALPPPAPAHGVEEMLLGTLSPYQLVSVPIAWLAKSERWGIYKQGPACALGTAFKTAVSSYYSSHRLSCESQAAVSERAEDGLASSPLQPPPEFLHALPLPTEREEFAGHGTYLPHEL